MRSTFIPLACAALITPLIGCDMPSQWYDCDTDVCRMRAVECNDIGFEGDGVNSANTYVDACMEEASSTGAIIACGKLDIGNFALGCLRNEQENIEACAELFSEDTTTLIECVTFAGSPESLHLCLEVHDDPLDAIVCSALTEESVMLEACVDGIKDTQYSHLVLACTLGAAEQSSEKIHACTFMPTEAGFASCIALSANQEAAVTQACAAETSHLPLESTLYCIQYGNSVEQVNACTAETNATDFKTCMLAF